MNGTIALVGGGEFQRACDEMDRMLLRLAGGEQARVGILPTAAARENPGRAAENGARHFRRLGARAEAVMIVTRADAQNGRLADGILELDMVYLAGGDPLHLLETLRGSYAWQALQGLLARGGTLAGSSAGAMVLGGQMWAPGEANTQVRPYRWQEGLGAAPGVAVLPHHATLAARWDAAEMQRGLPHGVTLVGLDECTGLIGGEAEWAVAGAGEATVYGGRDGPQTYTAGQAVQI